MNISPLENLHKAFEQAMKKDGYVGPARSTKTNKLTYIKTKNIQLAEVFQLARKEIGNALKGRSLQKRDFLHLKILEHDGKKMYERYESSTKTWVRTFLKSLPRYTPAFLKKFLPSCFSNKMERAEKETLKEFKKYQAFIKDKIQTRQSQIENDDVENDEGKKNEVFDAERDDIAPATENFKPKQQVKGNLNTRKTTKDTQKKLSQNFSSDDFLDEEDLELQEYLHAFYAPGTQQNAPKKENKSLKDQVIKKKAATPSKKSAEPDPLPKLVVSPTSKDKIQKKNQKDIQDELKLIRTDLQLLEQFDKQPLSLSKFKNTLKNLVIGVQNLAHYQIPPQEEADFVQSTGIENETWNALKDPAWQDAWSSDDHQEVLKLLESTIWKSSFEKAQKYVQFGTRKIVSTIALALADETGTRFQEKELKTYQGQIIINEHDIEFLLKFLTDHDSCRPFSLVIQMQEQSLTKEFLDQLMRLKSLVKEIEVKGLEEINLKQLSLPEAEEYAFIQSLESFSFPEVNSVILSDHSKKDWTPKDFSHLLALCPTMAFLRECYQHCNSYEKITIPSQMLKAKKLDVSGFSIAHIHYLLSQFTEFEHLNLSDVSSITDSDLIDCIQQANLTHLKGLQLQGCEALTTDILFILADMPELANLSLPDLKKGKFAVNRLPKFQNPFKIKMLYTQSKATYGIASTSYTGPQIWSAVFQIPLARLGFSDIFTHQKRLDPKSVAYWLHAKDYQHLHPQTNITTILADSNTELNDDNLVEFIQKFPNTNTISLYHCPNVTIQGILALLKACPQVKRLDLTGNLQINEELLSDQNLSTLNNLNELIVTDTAIPAAAVKTFEAKGKKVPKLIFEETTLKLSDDDLIDEDALENILNNRQLTKILRIDLENCSKLNDTMLGKLLDRFNAPVWIDIDNKMVKNPQRLNAAVLNLKGCANITEKAFDNNLEEAQEIDEIEDEKKTEKLENRKIEPKILENLSSVIIDGTKISSVLAQVYSDITFQASQNPLTINMNSKEQLFNCISYNTLKQTKEEGSLDEEGENQMKKLKTHYLHDRIVVELFCQNENLANQILDEPVQTESEEFCNMTFYFKTNDQADPLIFKTHRDFLYFQTKYFLNGLRLGGEISKMKEVTILNQHITPQVTQALMDLFYNRLIIKNLDWKTAASLAEIIGPKNFKFSDACYQEVLKHVHNQFEVNRADEMLVVTAKDMLDDQVGRNLYEEKLLALLKTKENEEKTFRFLSNIAKSHELKKLKAGVERVEERKNKQLIQAELDRQSAEDAKLAKLIADNDP